MNPEVQPPVNMMSSGSIDQSGGVSATPNVQVPPPQSSALPQSSLPVSSPSDSSQKLNDPNVVALAKAIGMAESGGKYNDPGGGAYQFTPDFISTYAPKYLGSSYDQNNLTPEQQDILAYGVMNQWRTEGDPSHSHIGKYSPAEVASAWNTGDPTAYLDPNYGKNNTYGSTRKYVDQVEQNFNQYSAQSNTPPQQPTSLGSDFTNEIGKIGQGLKNTADSLHLDKVLFNGGTAGLGLGLGTIALMALFPEIAIPAELVAGGAGAFPELAGAGFDFGAGASEVAGATDVATGATEAATQATSKSGVLPTILKGLGIGAGVNDVTGAVKGLYNTITGNGGTPNQQSTSDATGNTQNSPSDLAAIEALNSQIPASNQASANLLAAQLKSILGNQGGNKMYADPNIQAGAQENATQGYGGTLDENGRHTTTFDQKQSEAQVGNLSNFVGGILEAEGKSAPMQHVAEEANYALNTNKSLTASEREEGRQAIQEELHAYNSQSGDGHGNMSLGKMEEAQRQTSRRARWNKTDTWGKQAAHKALSRGFRRTIESHTSHKKLYNEIKKKEQRLINGQKILKYLHGKKAPTHKSFNKSLYSGVGQYIGAYIGDKIGGPIGAVLGTMLQREVIEAVDKRHGRTIFETPEMRKSLEVLQKINPAVSARIKQELYKVGWKDIKAKHEREMAKLKIPRLAAPSFIPARPYMPPQQPGLVTEGKRPPATYEQAKKRSRGEPEYGNLYQYKKERERAKKAAGLIKLAK